MEIIIREAFLNAVIQAVERQRPELLAAHTARFHSSIPFPFNQNTASDSFQLDGSKSDLDFDIRASNVVVKLLTDQIQIDSGFKTAMKRTRKIQTDDANFDLGAGMILTFEKKSVQNRYPVRLLDAEVKNLQPLGLGTLFSWLALEALCKGIGESGFPTEIIVQFGTPLKIILDTPTILPQRLYIKGKIA